MTNAELFQTGEVAAPSSGVFIEIDYFQLTKKGQVAPGDVFLSQKSAGGARLLATLSDGLGSGIKANVLASLTATMISKFVLMDIPPERAAEIIVNSLPVCSERGLAYATFTLVDARHDMTVRFIEYDNPPLLIVRGDGFVDIEKAGVPIERRKKDTGPQDEKLFLSALRAERGDRLVFFSDGVTQAGMGGTAFPFGWGIERVKQRVLEAVRSNPLISASDLAREVVMAAENVSLDGPKDDITCGVLYFRKPRDLLVVTGPPFHAENDAALARAFDEFEGCKIISGGTSAKIIARELGKTITMESGYSSGSPAASKMDGVDLVCEGILTLGDAACELERGKPEGGRRSTATRMCELFLASDRITFMVGTKINEIHQDPTMPVELEIRRNVVKKIAFLLEEKYMKQVSLKYI